jgi:hypothetical protein
MTLPIFAKSIPIAQVTMFVAIWVGFPGAK